MIGIIILVICAILGIVAGMNIIVPYAISKYVAVAILAFIDSVFGALVSNTQRKFSLTVFLTGFFGNALIAIALVFLGEKLNVDIYLAAVIVFSTRLFSNFSIMRRYAIDKVQEKIANRKAKKEEEKKETVATENN